MVEYKVRPITRYIVTRFHSEGNCAGVETKGEFDNLNVAWEVAYSLCRHEHDAAGAPPDDPNFIYPAPIEQSKAELLA